MIFKNKFHIADPLNVQMTQEVGVLHLLLAEKAHTLYL